MKVIFDCDNTMGVKGCDVNGGLALLYLLGRKDIELCGITTTYGNGNIDTVYQNTSNMLKEIGRSDIQLLKGCPNRYILESEAADYLVETINANPGNISILATGPLTNLYAAYIKDPAIFEKIPQMVIMGGLTKELEVDGKIIDELNFSGHPLATQRVMKLGNNISIITRNAGLSAFIDYAEFVQRLSFSKSPLSRYMINKCAYWFEYTLSHFKVKGFYSWDILAAAFLANPKLFENSYQSISLDKIKLETGLVSIVPEGAATCTVNFPVIMDAYALLEDIYGAWLGVKTNIAI